MFWLNDIREKIKADNPGIAVTDLTRKAGEMWKEVKDRSVWEAKAVKAKEAYDKAMKEYAAAGGGKAKASPKEKESPKEKKAAKPSGKPSKTPPKMSTSGKSPMKMSDFKSKEYISTDEESSHESEEEEKSKKKKSATKPANKTAAKKTKKKESSEDEEEIDSTPASSEVSDGDSD